MGWFNFYGFVAMSILMIPNIIFAVFDKASFENTFHHKPVQVMEQIGRYGCFVLMIFDIPYTYAGFWFSHASEVYLAVSGGLLAFYCLGWMIYRKSRCVIKMLWLSIIPTVLFLFRGIVIGSVPLVLCSVLFGIGHITISYKNSDKVC